MYTWRESEIIARRRQRFQKGYSMKKALRLAIACAVVSLSLSTVAAAAGAQGTTAKYGSVAHHGTRYTVTGVRLTSRIGDGFLSGKADGVFVVVNLTLTNLRAKPATILATNLGFASRGRTYDTTTKAFAVFDNGLDISER